MLLRPLGWLYGRIANLRNALYDRKVIKSYDLGARTISIGNITTGGTGKTPLVAHVADILADAGEKVCILTRGYGRGNERERVLVSDGEGVIVDARTGGDEPVELARKLIGKAIVVADADRVAAASWAREKFGVTVFVLDDAFQHRRAKRDLDIVCVDATDPFGGGRVLPAGTLREPLKNIARADALVLTRWDLVTTPAFIEQELVNLNQNAEFFGAAFRIGDVTRLEDFKQGRIAPLDDDDLTIAGAFAFSALGNSEVFSRQLAEQQFAISGSRSFKDHHVYQQSDIVEIEQQAALLGSSALVTTAKDAVKLSDLKFTLPCFVIEVSLSITNPADFRDLVLFF